MESNMVAGVAGAVHKLQGILLGCGYLFFPEKMKKVQVSRAIAEAEATIAHQQTLESALVSGEISLMPGLTIEETKQLYERAKPNFIARVLREEHNHEAIVGQAYIELSTAEPISDKKPEDDWIHRFMDYAGKISDVDTQKLWAKILAGEVNQPGSFSLKTLETLKTLSREDIKIFINFTKFVSSSVQVLVAENDEKKLQIDFHDKYILSTCGLLATLKSGQVLQILPNSTAKLSYHGKTITCVNDANVKREVPALLLTPAGSQLSILAGNQFDETYYQYLINLLQSHKIDVR